MITTPSGYIVELVTCITYGMKSAIKRAMMSTITATDGKMSAISAASLMDANDEAVRQLVISVTGPDGIKAENPYRQIQSMPAQDGEYIYAEVEKLLTQGDGKKKDQTMS